MLRGSWDQMAKNLKASVGLLAAMTVFLNVNAKFKEVVLIYTKKCYSKIRSVCIDFAG